MLPLHSVQTCFSLQLRLHEVVDGGGGGLKVDKVDKVVVVVGWLG
jgi:hypothetical protein